MCNSQGQWAITALFVFAVLLPGMAAKADPPTVEPAGVTSVELLIGDASFRTEDPEFRPNGYLIAFHGRLMDQEDNDIFVMNVETRESVRLTWGGADEREPSWSADGMSLVFSSNQDGDYDLYRISLETGFAAERVTDLPGDERDPVVNRLPFTFSAVADEGCGYIHGEAIESYEVVGFSRAYDEKIEVWRQGVRTQTRDQHLQRVSPEGRRCAQPGWSPDGLQLAFRCFDDEHTFLRHNLASWDQDFVTALRTLAAMSDETICEDFPEEGQSWEDDPCLTTLPRSYTQYELTEEFGALTWSVPSYSNNNTLLLASRPEGSVFRVLAEGAEWELLPLDVDGSHFSWSPDGTRLVFEVVTEDGPVIHLATTDFYLQSVQNLRDYPELYTGASSVRLQENRFVARPGEGVEFHHVYDQVAYQNRGPFVTADALLQVFHDEFARLLKRAERSASARLLELSEAMLEVYKADTGATLDADTARFLTVYFAVPTVLLRASPRPSSVDPWERSWCEEVEYESREHPENVTERDLEELQDCQAVLHPRSLTEKLVAAAPGIIADLGLSEEMATEVQGYIDSIVAHSGVETLRVPGYEVPPSVDFSQFQLRGHYEGSRLAAYFWAMKWFGVVPVPDGAVAFELLANMEAAEVLDDWQFVDTLVGGFMGRPIDVTPAMLLEVRTAHPELFTPSFQWAPIREALVAVRGEIPIRGIAGAMGGSYPLQVTLFPRRLGHDATFFTRLTNPNIPMRGLPSALDVMAALGSARAAEHLETLEAAADYAEQYRTTLAELTAETAAQPEAFWSTDIYHSWLAILQTLLEPNTLPADSALRFAMTDAWTDRELFSALAGYTVLKHDSVLYAFQESGVQCGGDTEIYGFVEQPVLPIPRGFVEPRPLFFRGVAETSARIYATLFPGENEPLAGWSMRAWNVRLLAERLGDISEQLVSGAPLSDDDARFLLQVGSTLELIFIGEETSWDGDYEPSSRQTQGVSLVTDIYTNLQREQALHIGIGRILDLFVVVPNLGGVGERMTQGGMYSFYEFWHPMANRLTDDAWWHEFVSEGMTPDFPAWTDSFIETP